MPISYAAAKREIRFDPGVVKKGAVFFEVGGLREALVSGPLI